MNCKKKKTEKKSQRKSRREKVAELRSQWSLCYFSNTDVVREEVIIPFCWVISEFKNFYWTGSWRGEKDNSVVNRVNELHCCWLFLKIVWSQQSKRFIQSSKQWWNKAVILKDNNRIENWKRQ